MASMVPPDTTPGGAAGRWDRRTFVRHLAAGAGTLVVGGPLLPACTPSEPPPPPPLPDSVRLFALFQDPPAAARPFLRWWWNDNRVTVAELEREMAVMAEAGFGGVEINPIAMVRTDTSMPGPGAPAPVPWLSDPWNRLVLRAVEAGRRLDLHVDLIVGTGWPFGGAFLAPEDTIQGVEVEVRSFQGPADVTEQLGDVEGAGRRLMQLKLFPRALRDLGQGVDLLQRVRPDGSVPFSVPRGAHDLYIVTWRHTFRDVMFGTAGAEGPVLDHFDRNAVEAYLNRMSDALEPVLGGPLGAHIRSVFCDSIELEGANWTDDLPAVFARRRGYALDPYLPLLLRPEPPVQDELVETMRRVRYDFSKTLAELFMERFIRPFHAWCQRHGTRSRYQSYGYPWLYTDLLDGYLIPDIPEGDQWLFNPGWIRDVPLDDIRYAIWNKYASSGGHLNGRRVVSTEAMTNTSGVFEASLEYIKQATDINFVTGVNHLVVHGYNYSPPGVPFPGWMRFGTYFSEHNPWWPYVHHWTAYTARLSAVFQEAHPVAQIAILGPTADVWSDAGLDRNAWNVTPWYLHALWQALNHYGYAADYVNGTVLKGATFEDGRLRYGPMAYRMLIASNVDTLEPEVAEGIRDFAVAGGTVLFVDTVPRRGPGWTDRTVQDRRVQQAVGEALSRGGGRVRVVGPPARGRLLPWTTARMTESGVEPGVVVAEPDPKLYHLQARTDTLDLFFFVNMDRERSITTGVTFPVEEKTPWRWDPEAGTRTLFPYDEAPGRLTLRLEPLESLLLVFEPGRQATVIEPGAEDAAPQTIRGPWQAVFEPVGGESFERTLPALVDFAVVPDLRTFAGRVRYRTTFRVEAAAPGGRLDLGQVAEIADVRLNGQELGVRWYGRRVLDAGTALQEGENELEVVVTTLLYNYCRSLDDNPTVQYWIERSRTEGPRPAGLIGPVRLLV